MEQLQQIAKWTQSYSKFELQVAIEAFDDLREIVKYTIDANPNSNTKPETLVYRASSLIIEKLKALQVNRV